MRRNLFVVLVSVLLISLACSKNEDFVNKKSDDRDERGGVPQKALSDAEREIVSDYFDNIKTLAFATNSLKRDIALPERYADLEPDLGARLNPIVVKLNYMDLTDEDTGEAIEFYNLPVEQRVILLDLLLKSDESSMVEKALLSSEILDDLKASNDAMMKVFRRHGLQVINVERNMENASRDNYNLIIKDF